MRAPRPNMYTPYGTKQKIMEYVIVIINFLVFVCTWDLGGLTGKVLVVF